LNQFVKNCLSRFYHISAAAGLVVLVGFLVRELLPELAAPLKAAKKSTVFEEKKT
jgi:hypothetical protein